MVKTWVSVAEGGRDKGKCPNNCVSVVMLSGSQNQGPILFGWIFTSALESGVK